MEGKLMFKIKSNRLDLIPDNEETEYLLMAPFFQLLKLFHEQFNHDLENCGVLLGERGDENCSVITYTIYATINGQQQSIEFDVDDDEEDYLYRCLNDLWYEIKHKEYAGFYFVIDPKNDTIVINFIKPNFVEEWAKVDYDDIYENLMYYKKCVKDLSKINKQNK